jgi:hypothetical protein
MKTQDLLKNAVNREPRERKKGFFYASEVGSIIQGYLTPDKFYQHKKITGQGIGNILSGVAFEAQWVKVLEANKIEFQHEPRYEVKFDDITITVKPDFEFADKVVETKFPVKLGSPEEYLERYQYQLELEYRATNKPTYLGIFSHPFNIDHYLFTPSEERFNKIKKALISFNEFL